MLSLRNSEDRDIHYRYIRVVLAPLVALAGALAGLPPPRYPPSFPSHHTSSPPSLLFTPLSAFRQHRVLQRRPSTRGPSISPCSFSVLDDAKTTDAKVMLLARGRELCDAFAAVIGANNYAVRSPFRVVVGGRDASSGAHRAFLSLSLLQKLRLTAKVVAASIGFATCSTEGLIAAYPSLERVIVDEEALYVYNSILRLQDQLGGGQWQRAPVLVIAPRTHLARIGMCSFNGGHGRTDGRTIGATTKQRVRQERKELKSVPDVCFSFRSYLATLTLFVVAVTVVLGLQYLELTTALSRTSEHTFGLGKHFKLQPGQPGVKLTG